MDTNFIISMKKAINRFFSESSPETIGAEIKKAKGESPCIHQSILDFQDTFDFTFRSGLVVSNSAKLTAFVIGNSSSEHFSDYAFEVFGKNICPTLQCDLDAANQDLALAA